MAGRLRVTLERSATRRAPNQKATVRALGLKRLNASVIHDDTPSIRGMLYAVRHLVTVQEVDENETA
ncbi:MAG: 50S ribosomal protein L30 [Anaerolineae bacterium]|nr:50S ribosomal protein L30 [Anaerolineae bacterium]